MERKDELIHEIGKLIITDRRYVEPEPHRKIRNWDALALVAHVEPGSGDPHGYLGGMTGYVYEGDRWEARTPGDAFELILDKLGELQALTKTPDGKTWQQCLIHITKPDYKINIQFEYDDPRRWSLKKVSLDMADYANFLRPPRD